VGVLIGGDSGAYRYREHDWSALTRFLREASRSHGIRFLVTTSRRTGRAIADALAAMAAEPDGPLETFIDFRTAGPGTLQHILAAADVVVCTDDSTTMLTETVGARVPLVAVAPQSGRLEPRETEFRAHLARQGWYRRMPMAELTGQAFLAALEEIAPRTTSARDELAAAIADRLPELFPAAARGSATPERA
jgi:mitochondrial fission protein ELM1